MNEKNKKIRNWMRKDDIEFADIIWNEEKKELHITSAGNITHAVLKENGKVTRRSMAACHPDDKYDFLTGARAALDRMQGKKPLSLEDVPTDKLVEELAKRCDVTLDFGTVTVLGVKREGKSK